MRSWGIRIWSFPMRYQPVTLEGQVSRREKSGIGTTSGRSKSCSRQPRVLSVEAHPSFLRAYGDNAEEFERLLRLPHAFIFHREYFEQGAGKGQKEEYESLRRRPFRFPGEGFRGSAGKSVKWERNWGRDISGSWRTTRRVERQIRQLMTFHGLDTREDDLKTNGRRRHGRNDREWCLPGRGRSR